MYSTLFSVTLLLQRNGPLKHKGFHLENFSYVVLKKGPRNHDEGEIASHGGYIIY